MKLAPRSDFQANGRSPVRAKQAAIATSHPIATASGLNVLRRGGNAIDAAIAAAAVLAVVEPQSTGIGGDGFMLYAPAGRQEIIGFNGSGRAPQAAQLNWFAEHGISAIAQDSPHAVTVPGVVDMWAQVAADHGTMPLGELLQDAIAYAEDGFVIADRVAWDWAREGDILSHDSAAASLFLKPVKAGDVFHNRDLAATLRSIAQLGREAFYQGDIAERMVAHLRAKGGLHTLADFAGARGEYVKPISTSYRGFEVHQIPPNNQGLTALLMLNILEGFDFSKLEPLSAQRLHYEIEAGRMAYAMRDQLIADMALAKVDVAGILDKQFAAKLRSQIRAGEAMAGLPPTDVAKSDTVYLCVADGQRNVVSFINSIYHSFGSGIVAPGTGVLLQNRGMGFSLAAGHPNCIAPGKRPLHTIMPGMVTLEGRPAMAYGVMGGDYQPFGHVHFLQNVIDFGLNPQAALDLPRVFAAHQKVEVEAGVPEDVFKALGHLGHDAARALGPLGGGQAILIDHEAGTVTAGSDPRKDGAAAGL